ncbi:DUF5954 family protein [Streptomyces lichenis]|uniref:DUF5954 family protein n=1 Tax=Streptomyces lichenis TaxID=2306967 RepID=A0ABT0IH48_9ACTN|nr:DUF5954 family protein [Streptomyces lichenis]MCK8680652.1 DUF5954 family protein [Streptomyces lichenis]
MERGNAGPGAPRPLVVRVPVEPVEAAIEADAVDAATSADGLMVRGPLFGVARQGPEDGIRWRVVVSVTSGCPQVARDSLQSLLWFRAKDEARDRAERRALLAAVARLEADYVDEVTVEDTRYRVLRAEEYAGAGPGGIEPPRPTDPEPLTPDWSLQASEPSIDEDLVLDPDAPVTPTQALEQLCLHDLRYTGERFPEEVLADSARAVTTHPDILLLPPTFSVVERTDGGWRGAGGSHATAHAARRGLEFSLLWAWPRIRGLIPIETDPKTNARNPPADSPAAAELAVYAEAADRLRAGVRVNRLEVGDTVYQIARTRRLLRWGPDGPEGPRPSDVNGQEPMRMHPPMDEDGNVLPEH